MAFLMAAHTDIGRKAVNQDAFCIRTADTCLGEIAMAVLCDGMGGADDGDKASEDTIAAFTEWFERELPSLLADAFSAEVLEQSWKNLIASQNIRLIQYGKENSQKLGTTASAILISKKNSWLVHIGDSRIYQLDRKQITQMTTDHSLVAEEVRQGILTPVQAKTDPRRNQLTQCVGVRGDVQPEFRSFPSGKKTAFLLCSDGFVHENEERDIWKLLNPKKAGNEEGMKEKLISLTEHAKAAGESDNITTVFIQIT